MIDSAGKGTLLSLYQGIKYAIEQNVDVINISLSTASTHSELIEEAIKEATDKGIIVVVAAGNYGSNVKYYTPAKLDNVITVASVNEQLQHSDFSNYGDAIDYATIGENVYTESYNGADNRNGTSYSAASVFFLSLHPVHFHTDPLLQESRIPSDTSEYSFHPSTNCFSHIFHTLLLLRRQTFHQSLLLKMSAFFLLISKRFSLTVLMKLQTYQSVPHIDYYVIPVHFPFPSPLVTQRKTPGELSLPELSFVKFCIRLSLTLQIRLLFT